jgi:hypothetical protein
MKSSLRYGVGRMKYEITDQPGYLQVDVFERLSGPEGEHFLRAMAAASRKCQQSRILIDAHGSGVMTEFEYYMLIKLVEALNLECDHSIAFVDKPDEVVQLNRFGESVVREGELNIRAFTDASAALQWLLAEPGDHALPVEDGATHFEPQDN